MNASPEIPEKFLGLGHQVYGFFGKLNKRINFEKFPRISLEFYSRNSQDFSQNFQVPFFSSILLCTAITKSFFCASLLIKNDNLL